MRLSRCWPKRGTWACGLRGAPMARCGGTALKRVESLNRQTVRFRPWRPCCSPLFPVARWGNAVPVSVAVACSDNANSAKPAAPLSNLPMWLCADELGTATSVRSSSVPGIHSAAGHVARHARSLSEPTSVVEASDPSVALLGSVSVPGLVLVLDTAFSSVEWFADSCPIDQPLPAPCGSHATRAGLERALLREHSDCFMLPRVEVYKHGRSI
jgi:hypothetical protein